MLNVTILVYTVIIAYIYVWDWDVKFGIQIGLDLPQMGQIRDFLRSVSVHFGSASQNLIKLILKVTDLSHLG